MYLSPEYAKFQKEKDSDMKRGWVLGLLALLVLPCSAQQIMYSNLKEFGGRAWRYGHHTESGEAFQESDLSDGGSGLPYRSEGQFRSLQIFEVSLLCGADGYVAICKL